MTAPAWDRRDRFVDLVRAVSIAIVVVGHWLAVVVFWEDEAISGENVLNLVEELWPLTWLFQVMPLFFFVGGFSNMKRWDSVRRRGGGYVQYLGERAARLLIPTAIFLAVGISTASLLQVAGLLERVLRPATHVATLPLWFLGVYLLVVAAGPVMLSLHRRWGVRVLAAMAAGVVAVDVVRFNFDLEAIGYLNHPLVWLGVHQLGFFYADGTLLRYRRWLAGAGCVALVGLLAVGPYPLSLVGLAAEEIDNMNPPTLPIAALAVAQVGIALMLRGRLQPWLARERLWRAVVAANAVIMTVFLWHLAAVIPTAIILYPAGFPQPAAGSALWWGLRPVWLMCVGGMLLILVVVFGRFEARGRRLGTSIHGHETVIGVTAAVVGAVYAAFGVIGFGRIGFEPLSSGLVKDILFFDVTPLLNIFHLLVGGALLTAAVAGGRWLRPVCLGAGLFLALMAGAHWVVSNTAITSAAAVLYLGSSLLLATSMLPVQPPRKQALMRARGR